jgi:tripartite-type tricarboxylate transporter receptor subunit TctC
MRLTAIAVLAIGLGFVASAAGAQRGTDSASYPYKPVRVIVPVAPGGSTDLIARIVMAKLSEAIGGPFVIDNRAGAGGILGNEIVAHAQPDGYTLLFTYAAHTIVPFIYAKIPYDVYRDFAPVTLAGSQPLLLTINSSVRANSVQELIALARAKPRELNVALATPSSSGALAAELFKIVTNTQMESIAFKGGAPAMTALVSGEVQLIFGTPPVVLPFAKSGKIKILGTTGKERASFLPEVPTLIEGGIKDFNTAPWQGILAPAGTPAVIIDRLYRQVLEVLKTPYTHERFAAVGTDVVGNSPKEFAQQIARELEQNSKVIKAVGMKGD